jgi:hypothetical protein
MKGACTAGLLLSLVISSSVARAQEPKGPEPPPDTELADEARDQYEAGAGFYRDADYASAATAFQRAYELSPSPELLYNLAQAERLSGDCAAALQHYEQLADLHPERSPADLDQKIQAMRDCESTPALTESEQSTPPISEPVVAPVPFVPLPSPAREAPVAATALKASAYGCFGGAAFSAAIATVLLLRAEDSRDRLNSVNRAGGRWSERYESHQSSIDRDTTAAIALLAVSGALTLAGTGLTFYAVGLASERQARVSATLRF